MPDAVPLGVLRPGRLLVANPAAAGPNFDRTVVMLLAYSEEGAVGVVLNRPSDTLAAPLPGWERLAAAPAVLFVGGPGAASGRHLPGPGPGPSGRVVPAIGLERRACPMSAPSTSIWIRTDCRRRSARCGSSPAMPAGAVVSSKPNWAPAPGGSWTPSQTIPSPTNPPNLWKLVLRRQGGPLSLVAAYPDDPAHN